MKRIDGYLYVAKNGGIRTTKRQADVHADEVRFRLEIAVPDGYFRRPEPVIYVDLPEPPMDSGVEVSVSNPEIGREPADEDAG